MKAWLILISMASFLAGCDEMSHQPKYGTAAPSKLFADGKSMQSPPDGTVGRDDPISAASLYQQPAMSWDLLQRGRERYNIYCAPCHDQAGYGDGTVPSRGFPHPPSFHSARLRQASASYFIEVITHGHGVMYSYADRVAPQDRWAIVAYIRALQLSQDAPAATLSDAERALLERDGNGS